MAKYQKVNGHYEIIPESKEQEYIDENLASGTSNKINEKLSLDILKEFMQQDSPADFMLKIFVPRYYNDGTKVSPDVIADIMANISNAVGGVSTWAGKGYWKDRDILYEDKNIFVETLLQGISPERATLFAKYIGSIIARELKQEGALVIISPVMADFISIDDYNDNEKEALENVKRLNDEEQKEKID